MKDLHGNILMLSANKGKLSANVTFCWNSRFQKSWVSARLEDILEERWGEGDMRNMREVEKTVEENCEMYNRDKNVYTGQLN